MEGREETALAVYWVTDGVDRCKVGFLQRHLVRHKQHYDGKLVQVVEFLTTSESPADRAKSKHCMRICRAVLIDKNEVDLKRSREKDMDKKTVMHTTPPTNIDMIYSYSIVNNTFKNKCCFYKTLPWF